ncbi:DoxX family protein [Alicyclobacillus sp. ALC3]|uniref:DoxX family protein n=1 Tax=Alicyclobacillus sp. ALC3 TaxID=2796143 RepID=UPI00237897FF|nr:DoxX family protein [Alicyclobacillus sp. ALC3]WDL98633.1 DoxX family protein [Alicyclobacillus sp. ALC3]
MFTTWLRRNDWSAGILAIARIFVGWQFLHAGWEKVTGPTGFTALGFLKGAVANPVLSSAKTVQYPWFVHFLNGFAIPNVAVINVLVSWGELLVGIGLITGTLTTAAMFFGMLMNFMYLFSGTISQNPLDILLGIFIIVAGYNAGRYGADYWVIPKLRQYVHNMVSDDVVFPKGTGTGTGTAMRR